MLSMNLAAQSGRACPLAKSLHNVRKDQLLTHSLAGQPTICPLHADRAGPTTRVPRNCVKNWDKARNPRVTVRRPNLVFPIPYLHAPNPKILLLMELHQFASSPSETIWVPPRWQALHVIQVQFAHKGYHGEESGEPVEQAANSSSLNERAEALDNIASEFNTLCAADSPLEDINNFLERWTDKASPGRVQTNVLAWLDDTNAICSACKNNNTPLVRLILAKGLTVQSMAVSFAIAQLRSTGNEDIVRLLLHGGWDINQCLNENTPPVLRYVRTDPFPTKS